MIVTKWFEKLFNIYHTVGPKKYINKGTVISQHRRDLDHWPTDLNKELKTLTQCGKELQQVISKSLYEKHSNTYLHFVSQCEINLWATDQEKAGDISCQWRDDL